MGQHGEEFILAAVGVLDLLIETGVFQKDSGASGQVLGQLDVRGGEATTGRSHRQGQHAHGFLAHAQRQNRRGAKSE